MTFDEFKKEISDISDCDDIKIVVSKEKGDEIIEDVYNLSDFEYYNKTLYLRTNNE